MIEVTLELMCDTDHWEEFCEIYDYSHWAVNEGGGDVTEFITVEQATKWGVI